VRLFVLTASAPAIVNTLFSYSKPFLLNCMLVALSCLSLWEQSLAVCLSFWHLKHFTSIQGRSFLPCEPQHLNILFVHVVDAIVATKRIQPPSSIIGLAQGSYDTLPLLVGKFSLLRKHHHTWLVLKALHRINHLHQETNLH